MLYVIKLGFEMVNANFFRIVDKNALRVFLDTIYFVENKKLKIL